MEYYRRYILPDLVRYYRGVFARRQIDPNSAFGDLVFAQQNLSTNVTAYIGILGSLWTSVVGVADFLQTDDLFQLAKPRELPELPDFNQLPHWACGHAALAASCANRAGVEWSWHRGSRRGPAPLRAGGWSAGWARPERDGLAATPTGRPAERRLLRPKAWNRPRGRGPPSRRTDRRRRRAVRKATGPRLDRRRDPDIGPVSLAKSYFGNEENRGGQAFISPMALAQSSFGKVGSRVGPAFLGPVQSYFGEEENHEGQNF